MIPRRWVVKVGSSSLTDGASGVSEHKIEALVAQVSRLQSEYECQMVIVSSGAVAAGLAKLGWHRLTVTLPEKQAAAAVGQGLLIETYKRLFSERGLTIAQILITRDDVADRDRFVHIRNTMETLLQQGILPVVNENDTVAVDEIRFGDNDTLAALVALITDAERLILLTDIDGLYTANPKTHPSATRLPEVWTLTAELEQMAGGEGSDVGTGGMKTKLAAAKIATDSGIDTYIVDSSDTDVLLRLWRREDIGTVIHGRPDRLGGKKLWMLHGTRTAGRLVIDQGAAAALREQSASLLLPGIVRIEGDFREGEVVECIIGEAESVCRGVVSFSSWDLRLLLSRRSQGERLHAQHEVMHRNQLVITPEGGR